MDGLNSQESKSYTVKDAGPSSQIHRTGQPAPVDNSPLSTKSADNPRDDLRSSYNALYAETLQPEDSDILTNVPPEILRGKYSTVPGKRPKPGLDRSLPPINKIQDIFDNMVATAGQLGLDQFLQYIGSRDLRVATMCSGTESPLLALEMIVDGISVS